MEDKSLKKRVQSSLEPFAHGFSYKSISSCDQPCLQKSQISCFFTWLCSKLVCCCSSAPFFLNFWTDYNGWFEDSSAQRKFHRNLFLVVFFKFKDVHSCFGVVRTLVTRLYTEHNRPLGDRDGLLILN